MNTAPILIAEDEQYPAFPRPKRLRRASASQVSVAVCYLASSAPVLFPAWRFELGVGDLRLPGIGGLE